jgi:hypothetical protein
MTDMKHEIELRCIHCGETSLLTGVNEDAGEVYHPTFACPTCGGSLEDVGRHPRNEGDDDDEDDQGHNRRAHEE